MYESGTQTPDCCIIPSTLLETHNPEQLPTSLFFSVLVHCRAASFLPDAKSLEVVAITQELWGRYSSEDFLFIFLVLINQYVTPVAQVGSHTSYAYAAFHRLPHISVTGSQVGMIQAGLRIPKGACTNSAHVVTAQQYLSLVVASLTVTVHWSHKLLSQHVMEKHLQ